MNTQPVGLYCFLITCCFWGAVSLSAQPVHQIEIGLGSLSNFAKDNLAAPTRYSGRGNPLSIAYSARSQKALHDAWIGFSRTGFAGKSLDRDDNASFGQADYLLLQWQYAYSRNLIQIENIELRVGPIWHTTGHVREYFYTPDNSEISWEVFSSIGLQLQAEYNMPSGTLEAKFWAPIVSYVNRPPYAVEGDDVFYALFKRSEFIKLGRLASWGQFLAFSSSVSYEYPFTSAIGARVGYRVLFYRYREPLTTAAALREFRLAVVWYI